MQHCSEVECDKLRSMETRARGSRQLPGTWPLPSRRQADGPCRHGANPVPPREWRTQGRPTPSREGATVRAPPQTRPDTEDLRAGSTGDQEHWRHRGRPFSRGSLRRI